MGTLAGHLLPGSFFILFGLWWSYVTAIRFIQSRMKSPYKKDSLNPYKTSVTMPCICCPCTKLRRAPVESYVKLIFATIGLLGEVITGVHRNYAVVDKNVQATTSMPMVHDHANGHEHIHRRDAERLYFWSFEHANMQHSTMYTAFIIGSIVEIMLYHRFDLPARIEYILGAIGFLVEGFLFANHLHGKDPLDIQVHTFLLNAIYGCVIFSLLETWKPNEVILTYGRITCTILQGTWFFQVGFVLYPPTKDPSWQWDKNNHSQMMIITASFIWHLFFIIIGLIIEICFIKYLYRSSKWLSHNWDDLIDIDDEAGRVYSNKDHNGIETKFLRLNSDDEDSVDENIEFDTRKLLKSSTNHRDNIKMKNVKENSASSSTTSGLDSKNSYSDEILS